jgi:hypothetical protein
VLGSFITEPAAMTICALLLAGQFFDVQPSTRLKYATLGMLFVNVSILTAIANAPNPAGQALLGRFFDGAILPIGLLAGTLLPTVIAAIVFRLL